MNMRHVLFWVSFIPLMLLNIIASAIHNVVEYAYGEIIYFLDCWHEYCFPEAKLMLGDNINVYRFEDEWYAGRNVEEVTKFIVMMSDNYVTEQEILGELKLVTENELNRLTYTDEPMYSAEQTRTFKEQLELEMNDGGDFPRFFALSNF